MAIKNEEERQSRPIFCAYVDYTYLNYQDEHMKSIRKLRTFDLLG
jgi:hypothetical protein